MDIAREVKSHSVILYACLLNILVFSGMVGYLDSRIYFQEGKSLFLKN